jgi:SAM-dependent methyltransferase
MFSTLRRLCTKPYTSAVEINRKVIAALLKPHGGVILEVGPGDKPILERLTHIPDQNKIALEFPGVSDYCKSLGYHCLDQDASAEEWKLADESMDIVVSNQCLEHIPNTDHFISEAHRVLRPGGLILLSVPNQGALAFIVLMLLTINPPMNCVSDRYHGLGNPFSNHRREVSNALGHLHLRLFMPRAMNDLLTLYGFQVLVNHGASWGLPVVGRLLARLFPYYGLYTTVLARKISAV